MEGESTSFGLVGVSYASRATTLGRFDLRDGNLGLMGKELRLIPTGRWAVADIEGISGLWRPWVRNPTDCLAWRPAER